MLEINPDPPEGQSSTLTRKRKRFTESWKRNVRKRKWNNGEEHQNSCGKTRSARHVHMENTCTTNCAYHCVQTFSVEERQNVHKNFWSLNEEGKLSYYNIYTERVVKQRCRTAKQTESRRKFTFKYHLPMQGDKIQVCKKFFLSVLDISEKRISYFHSNLRQAETGVHREKQSGISKNKGTPTNKRQDVRDHINSFPRVSSHYCRSDTSREYLEQQLTLPRMYQLYREVTPDPVKINVYRKIFNEDFNISFHKRKKDCCDHCEEFRVNRSPTEEDRKKFELHEMQKIESREERNKDRSLYGKNSEKVAVICFDLQNVITLPRASVSSFFYRRKLTCYNLTAHNSKDKKIYCAIWHEAISGRAGNHIASALIKILQKVVTNNPAVEDIILWSDACVPQNKNSVMSLALICFLQNHPHLRSITQKFGAPGHSCIQEVDSAHSSIEKMLGSSEVYSPVTLLRLFNEANLRKDHFVVIQMKAEDFLEYQKASKMMYNASDIPYTKIKEISYNQQEPCHVKYKLSFKNDEVTKVNAYRNTNRSGDRSFKNLVVKKCSDDKLTLSLAKKKDFTAMLKFMPQVDKVYFQALIRK